MPRSVPDAAYVVFVDPRSAWNGVVAKVIDNGYAERSCSPGEIGVFEATGEEREVDTPHETREGLVYRRATARVYRRTRTRLVPVLAPMRI